MMMAFGRTSIKRCLTNGVSKAPPLAMTASDDTSAIPFSMAATKRASHRIADHGDHRNLFPLDGANDFVGIQMVDDGGKTTVCPLVSAVITLHWAAPWISGGRIINLVPGPSATLAAISSTESAGSPVMMISAAEGRHEDVVLAPQHSLWHPGGAAGVQDVQVIG